MKAATPASKRDRPRTIMMVNSGSWMSEEYDGVRGAEGGAVVVVRRMVVYVVLRRLDRVEFSVQIRNVVLDSAAVVLFMMTTPTVLHLALLQ